ncbi:MAG: hypothetical protein WAN65_03770, partial [Candidatus Sulfotelmatobacter sp.]
VELCATRGELAATAKPAPQTKREIHYSLDFRHGNRRSREVFLVRRSPDLSLMPGMWELPELETSNGGNPLFSLRHSITVTNYTVRVWQNTSLARAQGKWIPMQHLREVALTGLARKILRKAETLQST